MWLGLADRNELTCVCGGAPCKAAAGEQGLPPALGTTPSGGLLPLSLMASPLFFQTDRAQTAWLGCPGWQQYKRSPGLLLCAHKPACPCPELRLEPGRLLFAALGPRSAAGSFKRRVVIRPEIQLPNLSTVSVHLIVKYSFIFCMKSELKY